jgi:hypothetical protein
LLSVLPDWHRQQLQHGKHKRWRGGRLALSEIMKILIHFHLVNRFFYPDHSATSQILGNLAFAVTTPAGCR